MQEHTTATVFKGLLHLDIGKVAELYRKNLKVTGGWERVGKEILWCFLELKLM